MTRPRTPPSPTLLDLVRSGVAEPTAAAKDCARLLRLYDRGRAILDALQAEEDLCPEERTLVLQHAATLAEKEEHGRDTHYGTHYGTARHQRPARIVGLKGSARGLGV